MFIVCAEKRIMPTDNANYVKYDLHGILPPLKYALCPYCHNTLSCSIAAVWHRLETPHSKQDEINVCSYRNNK